GSGVLRVGKALEVLLRGDAVLQRLVPVLLVVGREEGLAVAGAAAVVDPEDGVAVVDEVLDVGVVGAARLSARPAVDPHQRRRLRLRRGRVRLFEDGWDGASRPKT